MDEIARARGFVPGTIYGQLPAAIQSGKLPHAPERFCLNRKQLKSEGD